MIRRTLPDINVFFCDICETPVNGRILTRGEEFTLPHFEGYRLVHDICDQCLALIAIDVDLAPPDTPCAIPACDNSATYTYIDLDTHLCVDCLKHELAIEEGNNE